MPEGRPCSLSLKFCRKTQGTWERPVPKQRPPCHRVPRRLPSPNTCGEAEFRECSGVRRCFGRLPERRSGVEERRTKKEAGALHS